MNVLQKLSYFKINSRFFSNESYDVEKLFLNPVIYKLLQNITNYDPNKVHAPSISMKSEPNVHLLSNEQLEQLKRERMKMTHQKLQMPPIKNLRKDNVKVLERNEKLNKFLPVGNKVVFTDIGIKDVNRKRLIVVREANGDLRTATCDERDRINQTYFPISGREIVPPPLFNDNNLETMLNAAKYKYVLDLNCIQFEPDSARYIEICHKVYEHVNFYNDKLNGINLLSQTRHFGGLVLYLVLQNNCGNVPVNLLSNERFDAVDSFLKLYSFIHPESDFVKSLNEESSDKSDDEFHEISLFMRNAPLSETQKSGIRFHIDNYRQIRQENRMKS